MGIGPSRVVASGMRSCCDAPHPPHGRARRRPGLLGAAIPAAALALALAVTLLSLPAHPGAAAAQSAPAPILVARRAVSGATHSRPFAIDVAYAQKVSGASPSAAARINATIDASVRTVEQDFRRELARWQPLHLPKGVGPSTLTGTVSTDYLSPQIVAVTLDDYLFPAGAAHGDTVRTTLVFDAATGQRDELAGLFAPHSDWLALLSRESRQLLERQLPAGAPTTTGQIDAGTTAEASNFSAWAPTPFGLSITFGDYQVGAYALGDPQILVPYSALAGVARPGGLLAVAASGAQAASSGPTAMPLLPATTPPVGGLCDKTPHYIGDTGLLAPLTCGPRVNVAAWSSIVGLYGNVDGPAMLALPARSSEAAVRDAMCAERPQDNGIPGEIVAAERIAGAYHGWMFTAAAAKGFPRFCTRLRAS